MTNMTRRSLAAAATVTVLLTTLAACGDTGTDSKSGAGTAKYKFAQGSTLTAATLVQPPFSITDAAGNQTGFAIDLLNEAAKRMHVKVEYKSTDLQGTLGGLAAGQYDIGAGGFGTTAERKKTVAFTTPYYWGYTAVLTKKASHQTKLADFDGKRVGVVSGAVQEDFIAKKMPKAKRVQFPDQSALTAQLLSGNIDAAVLGGADAKEYVAKQPLRIAVTADSLQGTAFALRKDGDPKFLKDLDTQINKLVDDGTYVKLYKKYFHDPIAADLLKIRPTLKKQIDGTDLAPRN